MVVYDFSKSDNDCGKGMHERAARVNKQEDMKQERERKCTRYAFQGREGVMLNGLSLIQECLEAAQHWQIERREDANASVVPFDGSSCTGLAD